MSQDYRVIQVVDSEAIEVRPTDSIHKVKAKSDIIFGLELPTDAIEFEDQEDLSLKRATEKAERGQGNDYSEVEGQKDWQESQKGRFIIRKVVRSSEPDEEKNI